MKSELLMLVQGALIGLRELQAAREGLDPGDSQGTVGIFGSSAHTQELIWALDGDKDSLRALGLEEASR